MQIHTFQYHANKKGWSISAFPDLDSENTLVLLFAAPEFYDNKQILLDLVKHYPSSKIIGCSTAGEIAGSYIYDGSISVAVVKFEKTVLKMAIQEIPSAEDSFKAGKALIHELEDNTLRGVFILSDGLTVNGSELVKGVNFCRRYADRIFCPVNACQF